MVDLVVNGQEVTVDDSFLDLSPEQQEATVEEIAASLGSQDRRNGFMGQLNQGIAQTVGGAADLLNPFDTPAVANAFGGDFSTGSAQTGIENAMDAASIRRAEEPPEGFWQNVGRGSGQAAAMAPMVGGAAQAMSRAPGLLGAVSDDVAGGVNTVRGLLAETVAGGAGQGAQSAAEDAGAPDWAADTAGLLAGVGAGAAPYAAQMTPGVQLAKRGGRMVRGAVAPYTRSGAEAVSSRRLREILGGEERAAEVARTISPENEFGLTPAQQSNEPGLLAVEQEAARVNPGLRDQLDAQMQSSNDAATKAARGMGGNVERAQDFARQRVERARQAIQDNLQAAKDRAEAAIGSIQGQRDQTTNSNIVANELRGALEQAKQVENEAWSAVPLGAQTDFPATRQAAESIVQATPEAQKPDLPRALSVLDSEPFAGQEATVNELHGLYSALRQEARDASSGMSPNKNRARLANEMADAVLSDLQMSGDDQISTTINAARQISQEMHETFDQGFVGDLLTRRASGDERIDPLVTLERALQTRPGQAVANLTGINQAAPTEPTRGAIDDFMMNRFAETARTARDADTPDRAAEFLRTNDEVVQRLTPGVRQRFDSALQSQNTVEARQGRADRLDRSIDRSPAARFGSQNAEKALNEILSAPTPRDAATGILRTLRRDPSGEAVEGFKGAVLDRMIQPARRASGDGRVTAGRRFTEALQEPRMQQVVRSAFTPEEQNRLNILAAEMRKLDAARENAPDVGSLSDAPVARLVELPLRILAARQGAQAGGSGGGSIQTAQMASSNVAKLLSRLQNDRAAQMLQDAVTDPELMRALLMTPESVRTNQKAINRLAPYLVGATSGVMAEEE
jgi:hypothetical protein